MSNNVVGIDFFCGCGGTSFGLKQAGVKVLRGIDFDKSCKETYEANLGKDKFLLADITKLKAEDVTAGLNLKGHKLLLSACAPCQPFSKHTKDSRGDRRKSLLLVFGKFISKLKPDFVMIENVPGLQRVDKGKVFTSFKRLLRKEGYSFEYQIVNAAQYGVPQSRKRLILIASREGVLSFPKATHGLEDGLLPFRTVRDAIADLPKLKAGEAVDTLNAHIARKLNPINLDRIRHTPKNGGDRSKWPEHLVLDCHKRSKGHLDVYGRMSWDKPAPALTCRCTSISNGRFGHPTQDRGITPREAASIQTFPKSFKFFGGMEEMSFHIGNAVPVKLAKVFGNVFVKEASLP